MLSDVAWTFQRNRYKDVPSFVRAVEQFHTQAFGSAPTWKPDAIAIANPEIRVRLAARRIPSYFGEGALEEVPRRDPRMHTLRAPTSKGFTAGGLLYELHNVLRAGLEKEPDPFLAEVVLVEPAKLFEPALYELRTKYWLGTPTERPKGPLPREVLRFVLWSFDEPMVADRAAFVESVAAYQAKFRDLDPDDPPLWKPDELAIPAPVIWIVYAHESMLLLRSDAPSGFTAGELLHKLHAALAPKLRHRDDHFFEGLDHPIEHPTMPPGYFMLLGS